MLLKSKPNTHLCFSWPQHESHPETEENSKWSTVLVCSSYSFSL